MNIFMRNQTTYTWRSMPTCTRGQFKLNSMLHCIEMNIKQVKINTQ